MHVAKIERRHGDRVYRSYLLRRTYREGDRVQHETLGNLSHLPESALELIRRALRGEALLAAEDAFELVRTRPHGHVAAVLGTIRQLGLERTIHSRRSRERDAVVAMIAARVLAPASKLATARGLGEETAASTLGETLGLSAVHADDLYAALDWLLERQPSIEQALAKRHLSEGTLVLYDVSSTYFEGRHCPLARIGHSRDGKKGTLQIVFGVLCNAEGCPVALEVYPGNTGDPLTLSDQIKKLRRRFRLLRVVFVGDRGLLTSARLREELAPVPGLDWITALRADQIQGLAAEGGPLQRSLFDQTDLAEIHHPDFPGERLIACFNPLLAQERARKRQDLLRATQKDLDALVEATQRERRPLRGQSAIALRVGKVLGRFKVQKHFRLEITETSFRYARDETSIAREAALDGIYVIRTSVASETLSACDTVRAYKDLARVERAFRSLKTLDLHVRPIYHRLADRVRAHVFLCLLAYYVEWHMRRALAPLLFDEDDPAAAAARRGSIVKPARRSERALAKAASQRTPEDLPVHSFRTLLADLATLAKTTVQPRASGVPAFDRLTTPTPLQQQIFDRLGVRLTL